MSVTAFFFCINWICMLASVALNHFALNSRWISLVRTKRLTHVLYARIPQLREADDSIREKMLRSPKTGDRENPIITTMRFPFESYSTAI